MPSLSCNPATDAVLTTVADWPAAAIDAALRQAHVAFTQWRGLPLATRQTFFHQLARQVRQQAPQLARLISQEMGKPCIEAAIEIEKCAYLCESYQDHAAEWLADAPLPEQPQRCVRFEPLGVVLGIMPWNFPFWQVFRYAVPALLAGNVTVLKHAANVPQCAAAIDALFQAAGFPTGVFTWLPMNASQVATVIASPWVSGVTFTGSEPAGRQVAAWAGRHLKKCVLELGGADAFIVLADADLEQAVEAAVRSRFRNAGQACTAAKRFILLPEIAVEFTNRLVAACEKLPLGDPLQVGTQLGPLARRDLRDELHRQVTDSVAAGARVLTGGKPWGQQGAFYLPTVLDNVTSACRAYHEELFGPVASVLYATDVAQAVALANDSRYGLAASIWTQNRPQAQQLSTQLQVGMVYINHMVSSHPLLPFGGVKASGIGRELGRAGFQEFMNLKTVWMD